MIRKILVALDGSPSSNAASAVAIRLAARHKCSLQALGILETDFMQNPQDPVADSAALKNALNQRTFKDARQRIEAVLGAFAKQAGQADIEVSTQEVKGEPRVAIENAATGCDMIVLGKTSLHSPDGELSMMALRVEKLLRDTVRPIVLVPSRQVVSEPGRELSPIVVAFDGSVVSSRALHLFALLGLGRGRQVNVLTQNDGSTPNAEFTANQACEFLRAHGLRRVRAIGLGDQEAGKPAESILGTAKSIGASMVVMGAYGHRGLQEMFGSCTRSVLSGLQTSLFMYH